MTACHSRVSTRIVDVQGGFARSQIVIGDDVSVIDPGNARAVLAALEHEGIRGRDVRSIVLTHGDGDHWMGAMEIAAWSRAEIAAHEAERSYLDGRKPPPFSLPKRLLIRFAGRNRPRPRISHWLTDGDAIGGMTVIHAPGHTPGHICLLIGDTLIAGDAFVTGVRFTEVPRMMTSDLGRSRETIRSLARLDIARAFSGHGPPADDAAAKLRALAETVSAG